MRMKPSPTLIFLGILSLFAISPVNCANILFYHNIASYSHRVPTYPLADALAEKGHNVTFITPFHYRSQRNPKIQEIVPKSVEKTMHDFIAVDFDINLRVKKLLPPVVYAFFPTAIIACEDLLKSSELQEYFNQTTSLDLVIIDSCMAECGAAIGHKFNAKLIMFDTVVHLGNEYDLIGFNPESSSVPELEIFSVPTPISFLDRVVNTLISLHFRYVHYKYMIDLDKSVRKYLDVGDMPFLDDVARNISLVFYTGDVVTDYPRSQPPLLVNIGGIHCRPGKPLPVTLESFITGTKTGANSSDGFVYISLGSLVVSSNLPDEIKQVFFDTITSYPQLKFLWKWDGQVPDKIPDNLYLSKWFPQQDVLAHSKIKAFVTQTGRPSILEAVYHGVPMISFPTVGDQDFNANRLNGLGVNVLLELGTVTREQLKDAVQKVVYDSRTKARMLELRQIFLDRPSSPLDTALWWTEYVLRHPNTDHLRPSGFSQTWYQRRLIDVWAFLFTIICLIFIISLALLMILTRWANRLTKSMFQKRKLE